MDIVVANWFFDLLTRAYRAAADSIRATARIFQPILAAIAKNTPKNRLAIYSAWLCLDDRNWRSFGDRYQLHEAAYTCTPTADGWQVSSVFRRSFQLRRENDSLGNPRWNLMVRQ